MVRMDTPATVPAMAAAMAARDDGGASVPCGVYFSRLEMPGTTITRKLVLAR